MVFSSAHLCLAMLTALNEEAYDLYSSTVGRRSPLFCGAAEGKAKALQKEFGPESGEGIPRDKAKRS